MQDAHPPLWPHQERGVALARQAQAEGCRAVLVTVPTGGGKTLCMATLSAQDVAAGRRVALFTNRKVLLSQTGRTLAGAGLDHGVVAAGHELELLKGVQLCSFQTVDSRVLRRGKFELPPADVVHVDEAHSNKAQVACEVIAEYRRRGATVFGWTATPVGLGGVYDRLVVAGTNSELRRCGALVRCDVVAPEEPDLKGVHRDKVGEFVLDGVLRTFWQVTVHGDIFGHWMRHNALREPTICFAPGVKESRWVVEKFLALGVPAAHVDGDTPDDEREQIFRGLDAGDVRVVSSCGVLREGFDSPRVACALLLQPFGRLSTYLQAVGRILRSHPAKQTALLIDFSGAWWRHGSPNADRQWRLEDTDKALARARKLDIQRGDRLEGVRCPQCHMVRATGPVCPFCGKGHVRSVRHIRMVDGTLTRKVGAAEKRKRQVSEDQRAWQECLHACGRSGRTLRQAAAWFYQRTGHHPGGVYPLPEAGSLDWHRPVAEWDKRYARKGAG